MGFEVFPMYVKYKTFILAFFLNSIFLEIIFSKIKDNSTTKGIIILRQKYVIERKDYDWNYLQYNIALG